MNNKNCVITGTVYSVEHNEDAPPFADGNLLIVADGVGGSGATVHHIKAKENMRLGEEIRRCAFGDFDGDKTDSEEGANRQDDIMREYLDRLLKPMADETPDSSALWASRIAIARCAHALRSEYPNCDLQEERDKLSAFILKGMNNTADYFELKNDTKDSQLVLPTTLALIRHSKDEMGKIVAEAVWAGDSRCYALTKDGLRQLSIDEENASGEITNSFYVGGKENTKLCYKRHVLDAPCILLTASDGIFEPLGEYCNLEVEAILLEHIKNSKSVADLMTKLREHYRKVRGDDATMAFAAIGFENFDEIKKFFKDRGDKIIGLRNSLLENATALDVLEKDECDVRGYVETRTGDKMGAILMALISHPKDIVCSAAVKDLIEAAERSIAEEIKKEKAETLEKFLNTLHDVLGKKIGEPIDNLFNLPKVKDSSIVQIISELCGAGKGFKDNTDKLGRLREEKEKEKEYKGTINDRICSLSNEYADRNENNKDTEKISEMMNLLTRALFCIDKSYNLDNILTDKRYRDKYDIELLKEINEFIKHKTKGSEQKLKENVCIYEKKYRECLKKLIDALRKNPALCPTLFSDGDVKEFNLTVFAEGEEKGTPVDRVVSLLIKNKDDMARSITDSLAENYMHGSAIDEYYMPARLNDFRTYYRLKTDSQKIRKLKYEIETLEKESESLLEESV